ncbi:MAG: hypothetical protein JWP73_209 [Phenylobacterium sp.]|nr:hypothetical protein [Phenylobacterium sp.]
MIHALKPVMRALRPLPLAALLTLAAAPAFAEADPAFGEWLTEDGLAKVAVAPCPQDPSLACGAVTWLKDPVGHPTRDVNNPDRALRGRPLVGVQVIREMKLEAPGRWAGGKVYDAETGKSYNGKLRAVSRNRLQVQGCVLMICQSQAWTRAND